MKTNSIGLRKWITRMIFFSLVFHLLSYVFAFGPLQFLSHELNDRSRLSVINCPFKNADTRRRHPARTHTSRTFVWMECDARAVE